MKIILVLVVTVLLILFFAINKIKTETQNKYTTPIEKSVIKTEPILTDNKNKTKQNLKTSEDKKQQIIDFRLKAIVIQKDQKSWIMVEKNNNSKILFIGDSIDNFILKQIYKNYVIFEKNNIKYKLQLNFDTTKNTNSNLNGAIKVQNRKIVVDKKVVDSYKNNISKIYKEVRIDQHKNDGKADGFIVKALKKGGVVMKLGLKRGDIIVKVNNDPVVSYIDAFKVYYKYKNDDKILLTIIRDGKQMELNYEIK